MSQKIKPEWTPIAGLRGWQVGEYRGPRRIAWYGRRCVGNKVSKKSGKTYAGAYQERKLEGAASRFAAEIAVRKWRAEEVGATYEERLQLHLAEQLPAAEHGAPVQSVDWSALLPRAARPADKPMPAQALVTLTVADAVNAYLAVHTAAPVRSMLDKHVLAYEIARRPIAELTRAELERWQRHGLPEKNGDRAKRTRNRVWAQFKAALNLAYRDHPQAVPSDRAWRGLSPLKVAHGRRRALTDEEFAALLGVIPAGAFRNLVIALRFTGARSAGELAPCTVADLDVRGRTLLVHGTKGTGDRVVNLPPDAAAWFAALAKGKAPGDVLIPNAKGAPWETWRATKAWRAARKRAGLRPDAVLYCIRHACATAAIYNSRPELLTARQLGTSVQMLQRTYVEALAQRTQKIVDDTAPTFVLPAE